MSGVVQALLAAYGAAKDAYFKYVTLLLPGNGTNGAQNNTFLDSSTNNFTITRNGNTTQGTFSPYGANWSNYFDGTGDYLSAADNAAWVLSGDFTIEAWVYPTVGGVLRAFIAQWPGSGGASNQAFYLGISSTNYAQFTYGLGGSNTNVTGTSASVITSQWNHIAVTRSGTSVKLFVNGVQDSTTATVSGSLNDSTGPLYIGCLNPTDGFLTTGYISNARLVNGTAVYTANFTPPTAPLTAITNTSLLTCQSNRFIDNSSNNFTITRNGDVSVQRFSPFAPTTPYAAGTIGGSGYFDGTGDYLTAPDNAVFDFGSGDYTIEMWVVPATTTPSAGLVVKRASSAVYAPINVGFGGSLAPAYFVSFNGSTWGINITSSISCSANAWNHIAVTRSGSTFTIWVNGQSGGTGTSASAVMTNTAAVSIGATAADGSAAFNGYISNVRIVKGTAVYTSAFTPPTAPLTAITNTSLLLNFTNGGIIDNAMMNDLETVGNAQISTSVSKFGGGSLAFDGNGDYLLAPFSPDNRINTTGNFTIEFWAYFNSVASNQRLIGWDNNSTNFVIAIYTNTTGNLAYYLSSNGTSWNIAQAVSMGSIAVNTWYHIALVRNGSTFTPYINGVAGTTTTSSATLTASTLPFSIGAISNGQSPFNGYIDDFRITKGYARYTANFTPPAAPFPLK